MQIREGAYYRTRGGHIVGPIETTENFGDFIFWVSMDEHCCWKPDGSYTTTNKPHDFDLISEVYVSDTPPTFIRIGSFSGGGSGGGGGASTSAPAPETKTLRDEFAMAALAGIVSDPACGDIPAIAVARAAHKYADAMMEARKK